MTKASLRLLVLSPLARFGGLVSDLCEWMTWFISAEWLLAWRCNGGSTVLLRAGWATLLLYFSGVGVWEITKTGAIMEFDANALRAAIHTTIPWAAAIFGATYAALYARFASQWSYLAALYNQIMDAQIAASAGGPMSQIAAERIAAWKAAYVEDAEDLHLVTRPMYAHLVADMLRDADVRRMYLSSALGGRVRLSALRGKIFPIIGRERRRLVKKYGEQKRRR